MRDFAEAQAAVARDVGADLENRLKDLGEDGQLVARLAHETWKSSRLDSANRAEVVRSAFRALATIVRHYRSIVLFPADGTPPIYAIDPVEGKASAQALLDVSARTATAEEHRELTRMAGPTALPDGRPIYLYAVPLKEGVVVIAVDGPRLLYGLMRGRSESRLLLLDGGSTLWTGCGEPGGCRPGSVAAAAPDVRDLVLSSAKAPGTSWPPEKAASTLGLPSGAFAAASARASYLDQGGWTLVVATTAGALHEREQKLVRQLLATMAGLLIAVGLIGGYIIRQQRRAISLAERLRHAEALRSLEDQLIRAEKLATTGVLAAGIAHEVGTPLGVIRGRAELLLEPTDEDSNKRGLNAIIQQIDRISGTIRQVLDFSRAQPVRPHPVSAAKVMEDTLELLAHRFRQQNLSVHVDADPYLVPIAADRDQLQQVLINVLLNACDAMKRGGTLSIAIRPRPSVPGVEWEIRDDGCGIAPEHLHAVFDPFFTTKKRGEGTGLGLSVVASIVRNHGGEIALSSTLGEGTSVRIFWPADRKEVGQ